MKIVKISIQDENTLVLQEDASKGDLIDLKSIHEIDIDKGTIESVVSSIKKDKFREELDKAVKAKDQEYELKLRLEAKEIAEKANAAIGDKDALITRLQSIVDSSEIAKELAITKAVGSVEKERDELKIKLSSEELDKKRIESSLTEKYETQIKDRNDTIERLKDM